MIRHWFIAAALSATAFGCLPEGRTEAEMGLDSPDCDKKEHEQFVLLNSCVVDCLQTRKGPKPYSLCESKCLAKLSVSDVCLNCVEELFKAQCSTIFGDCKDKCDEPGSIPCVACASANCGVHTACQ